MWLFYCSCFNQTGVGVQMAGYPGQNTVGITDGWASLVLHVVSDPSLSEWPLQQGRWTFYTGIRATEAEAARPS